jgi:DNA (cytosine-5)-methyltransferase 1
VFVVGYLGDWRPAAAVLFERESLRRDTAPSREAGQKPAPTVGTGAPFSRTGNGSEADALQPYAVANCLTARMHKGINSTLDEGQTPVVAIGLDEEQNARVDGFGTLKARMDGGGFEGSVMTPAMVVRRLTPVECERLQGFPDGYTNIPWRGKPESPDGPRYKALGNSMAVPVMRWIGERINGY